MARESATFVLRHFQTLFDRGVVGNLADGELLHQFMDGGGLDREDAFAALVDRHGPMVLKVCRRMLPTPADAEDAFQAVFLVLARKAGSLRGAETLKPWLYGVAVRTAQEARRRTARRRSLEERATAARPLSYEPLDGGDDDDPPGAGRGDHPPALALPRADPRLRARGGLAPGRGAPARAPRGDALQPAGPRPGAAAASADATRHRAGRGGRTRRADLGRRGGHDRARSPLRFRRASGVPVRVIRGRDRDHPGGRDLAGSGSARDPEGERVEAPGRRDGLDRRGGVPLGRPGLGGRRGEDCREQRGRDLDAASGRSG